MSHHDEPYPILHRYRVTIPMRLRFAAEVWHAAKAVQTMPGKRCRMRERRVLRLAMEKVRGKHMRQWRQRNVR
jgi:hypothetical protein